jgi:protoporphyrinogen oxidase
MHVLVLGAGLAGLAAADELTRAGLSVTVLEKEQAVGGLAQSFRVGPYWLDHGPHRFFSRDAGLVEHLYDVLGGAVVVRRRKSRIHLQGRYFDYPLRLGNVVRNLPTELLLRAARDYGLARLRERIRPTPDAHFEAWVEKRFGRTLYDLFFGAYTEKAWKMSPRNISADWASQRISQRSLLDALLQALRPPRDGDARSLATEFYYPREGGIGALARAYARRIVERGGVLLTGARVRRLEHAGGRVRAVLIERGGARQVLTCDHVVNTTPLPALVAGLRPALPSATRAAAARLRHIGIVFAYVEVARPSVSDDHWIYLPEKHLAVHRVSEFKNFSDDAAPGDRTALCCEITCRPGDETWTMSRAAACALATADLAAAGLVDPVDVRPLAVRRVRHAYPVYDVGYRTHLRVVRDASKELANLTTTGRQGLFRYNNMDHSIAMGHKAARSFLLGRNAGGARVAAAPGYFG